MKHLGPVQSVLVAYDLSEMSRRALAQALALVPPRGRVFLFHVELAHPLPGGLVPTYQPGRRLTPDERAVQRELARKELERALPQDGRQERVIEVVEDEDVARAILAAAKHHDVDLVCLGTHGHGPIASALLGSVASAVLKKIDRPLLLVPPERG
ncbi:MAG: universal stress protein [Planctomycetes bacterium]|nr:universal stress protein [Planctomycetota bacterium]